MASKIKIECVICETQGTLGPHCVYAYGNIYVCEPCMAKEQSRQEMKPCSWHWFPAYQYVKGQREKLAEYDRLINTPEVHDFLEAVKREAAHQTQRWGKEHDMVKTDVDWAFLVGHLLGRSVAHGRCGDWFKQLHHLVTAAAALFNYHRQLTQTPVIEKLLQLNREREIVKEKAET